jgi:hypothetical protein
VLPLLAVVADVARLGGGSCSSPGATDATSPGSTRCHPVARLSAIYAIVGGFGSTMGSAVRFAVSGGGHEVARSCAGIHTVIGQARQLAHQARGHE